MKTVYAIFVSFVILLLHTSFVFAGSLSLTNIGAVATEGMRYNEWWYVTENPSLQGTTDPGVIVIVDIDSVTNSVTADSSGNWTYYPTTLTTGDHEVSVSADDQKYSFTLHIGSDVPTGTSSGSATTTTTKTSTSSGTTPSDLPVSGSTELTFALLAGAAFLLFAGYKFVKSS